MPPLQTQPANLARNMDASEAYRGDRANLHKTADRFRLAGRLTRSPQTLALIAPSNHAADR